MGKRLRVGKNAEFYAGIGMLSMCILLCWQITQIDVAESKLIPGVILVIVSISTGMQFWDVFKKQEFRDIKSILIKRKELLASVLLLSSYWGYSILGFYTTIALLLTGLSFLVQKNITKKKIAGILLYDVILLAVTYLCFNKLLGLVTPVGLFI